MFELVSSVLSLSDYCKKLEFFDEKRENIYKVVNETPCPDSSVHYVTMNSKKQRISAALLQIKQNSEEISPAFHDILKFFTISIEQDQNEPEIPRRKPTYCRGINDITASKPACADCHALCSFTLEDILSPTHGIGQKDLLAELTAHKHPKTRRMTNDKLRTTSEAARELADHYIYSHKMNEPQLL